MNVFPTTWYQSKPLSVISHTQPQPTTFLQPTTTNHPLSAANNHNPTSFNWRTQIQWLEASTSTVHYFVVHATLFCHHLTGWPSCHHGSCRLPLATHLHTFSPPAIDPILALPPDLQPWVSILFSMIQIFVVFQSAMFCFFCLGDLYWNFFLWFGHWTYYPVLVVWCYLCCWFDVVCVAEEIFIGLVGVAIVNGLWTCWLLDFVVLNLSSCN